MLRELSYHLPPESRNAYRADMTPPNPSDRSAPGQPADGQPGLRFETSYHAMHR